jgi:small multidrug resistance family-3 protein
MKTATLFVATAIAEIVGCFLPYLWLRRNGSAWLLAPAIASLALFAWLLSVHPNSAGRTYAAYGGVYVTTAMIWLWVAEHQVPTRWDLFGASLCVLGTVIIVLGSR